MALAEKRHITVFALITALCLLGDSMLYVVLPVHFQEAGLSSLWEVGIILAVNRFIRLPLNPCIGWFYRHVSERTGIFIAVILASATTFSYGFLPNFAFWLVARCVWGLAWTLLRLGALFCILKISTAADRGHYTGLYNGLFRLGSLVGMLLGSLLSDLFGMRPVAVLFGFACACAALLVFFYIPNEPGGAPERADAPGGAWKALLANRRAIWVIMSGGLVAFVLQGVFISSLSRLMAAHTGGGLGLFQSVIGAATLGGFFQSLRWGWEPWLAPWFGRLCDLRIGWPRMLMYAFAAGAVFFALSALPLPLAPWFACIIFLQLTATALTTASEASAADCASAGGGRALLINYALAADLGAAFGPLAAFSIDELFGINAVYLFSAGLFALLAGFWLFSAPFSNQPPSPQGGRAR